MEHAPLPGTLTPPEAPALSPSSTATPLPGRERSPARPVLRLPAGIRPYLRPAAILLSVLAVLATVVWAVLALVSGVEMRDFEQHSTDNSTGGLGTQLVAQSFRSPRSNLSRVDVQLTAFTGLPPDGRVRLVAGEGPNGPALYDAPLSTAIFTPTNPYLSVRFSPVAASAGQTYTLVLETPGRPIRSAFAVAYSSIDALSSGQMYTSDGAQPGDLTISGYYRYDAGLLWGDLLDAFGSQPLLIAVWLLLTVLPGLALLAWIPNSLTPGQRLLAAPALTALALPVFFLVMRVLGLHLGTGAMWALLSACLIALVLWAVQRRPQLALRGFPAQDISFWGLFAGLLVFTLATRLASLRDQLAGMGLDAYHHTMIAQLFVRNGGIPSSYEPYAPLSSFTYHFGFHGFVATLALLTGRTQATDVMVLMPQVGQVAGSVLPLLTLTLFAWKVLGNRWVGLAAGALAGLVTVVPAFYVDWSRYTEGMGLALLPASCVFLLEALDLPLHPRDPNLSARRASLQVVARHSGPYMLAVIGAAGIFLTHYRISVLYAGFVGLYVLWRVTTALGKKSWPEVFAPLWRAALVAVLALGAISPWIVNLRENFRTNLTGKAGPNLNDYYSAAERVDVNILHHPSLPALAVLCAAAALLVGWNALGRHWQGLALGAVSGLPLLGLSLYVFFNPDLAKMDKNLQFLVFGLSPVTWVLLISMAAVWALAWFSKRAEALVLLPALAWLILGLWSSPQMFPFPMPFAGYLDAVTLTSGAYVPATLVVGYLLAAIGGWLPALADAYSGFRRTAWRAIAPALLAVVALIGGLASGLTMVPIVDPKPYVTKADVDALVWMRDNLPRNSSVLADPFAFPWSPDSVLGSDAGLWVPLVTGGVSSSVPPMTAYNERLADPNYLARLRGLMGYEPLDPAKGADWNALKASGITHIFVGSRSEHFPRSYLLTTDHARVVFHEDSVWVFAIQ